MFIRVLIYEYIEILFISKPIMLLVQSTSKYVLHNYLVFRYYKLLSVDFFE